ncbi:MAG TPA: ubiquinol oxidase subunit II [Steroidobacteraceae bacterium]|nr:ubiquinol oxidase subunit II [Steroidobacteraceae bacterium]
MSPSRLLTASLVLAMLEGCSGVLSPVGPVGSAERIILVDSLAIMLAIVVPTVVATLAFGWWFRATNTRARYMPEWAYSGRLELIVWSIPALVVFFLGGIAWIGSHELDPARPLPGTAKPLEIDVVALDWKWLFIYPGQGIASVNELVAPAGIPLHLRITSASVLNVFFVPRLGSEIYAMHGMTSQLNLQADRPGVYPGLSAQFSGDGFPDMSFAMHAVTPAQFTDWAATTHASGPELDESAYRSLLRQSTKVAPYTYSAVQAGLFEDIVQQKLPAGAGPPPAPES